MNRIHVTGIGLCLAMACGCGPRATSAPSPARAKAEAPAPVHAAAPPAPASAGASPAVPRVAKIWVSRDGSIELNGARVEIGAVESELAAFAGRGGVVVYGRDDPDEPPPAVGMRVIELVVEHQLPIRLTVKRDFSDAEDAGGGVQEWGASGPSAAP